MFDLGISKIMLIGVVALVVIGPERLPRVARTVGALMGKAQRYVNEVKREVNQAIEIDELNKAKASIESAARDLEHSVRTHASDFQQGVQTLSQDVSKEVAPASAGAAQPQDDKAQWEGAWETLESETPEDASRREFIAAGASSVAPVAYVPPRKNWRSRRQAVPAWYKARQQVRTRLRSGTARAARSKPGPMA
ncbi:Sec-independent protein translocase subunit TatB [Allofranklinella schreckenbergeri]|uniref:Sec-independent protein translocase protein TatB n=1 Tax=Allofranklinella schreckenbergeri TaxID=1076744 RepID=A0A3M6QF78_9BURK|nr:Sec-independent protein translocase protein TatB [Allofranklinella schreckenbergeri]RMX01754.1 Sec-independent protein translocase subunit TatB [Allofranklinella schreckenbergeri]RMX07510.1 Sec-independent protein translocase subunit TatB [Allofranklinella schreckenbergeri]